MLLMLFGCAATAVFAARWYRHKSEAELARMTPAQRVDEWVNEQVRHGSDLDDDHEDLIKKYVLRDGLAALPRLVEIIGEYDPTRPSGRSGGRGERFDACWEMLGYLDRDAVRLRGTEEGRRALDALERAVRRMRAAGHGQKDQHDWARHGRFDLALMKLEQARGIGFADEAVRHALWVRYRVGMSDEELLAFSNFLVARDPFYPGWSGMEFITDDSRKNEAGYPTRAHVMKKPERFYEAYLEFKNTKR
jgi:hypothetical protein